MKSYVLDANVIIKWIFKTEVHAEKALDLLHLIEVGDCQIQQPAHWLAEVIAVVSNTQPNHTIDVLASLSGMNFLINNEITVYEAAVELSIKYKHPLFDTLYHAVALMSPNAVFITDDRKYYNKAKIEGSIILLSDF